MNKKKLFNNGHALIVGVGADLPMTITDATGLYNILTDPKRSAYNADSVTLLTENAATKQSILNSLDKLISDSDEDSTVIVYYSGHGGGDKTKNDYFIVPHGFQRDDLENTVVSIKDFTNKLYSIKTDKLVVILDCSNSAEMADFIIKKTENYYQTKSADTESLKRAPVVLASASKGEPTMVVHGSNYSVFTEFLINALSGKGNLSPDGYARVLDVLSYLYVKVPLMTDNKQHPYINNIYTSADNFPICFYAGGEKESPELAIAANNFNITDFEHKQLSVELVQRQDELKLLNKLIGKFKRAILMTEDYEVLKKENLVQQLTDKESKKDKLLEEIRTIDRKFSSNI